MRIKGRRRVGLYFFCILGVVPPLLKAAEFTPLGDLPGGAFDSLATDVSNDGTVIVGIAAAGVEDTQAFRWTQESGMVGLGDFPGGFDRSRAWGVSENGSIVAGQGSIEGSIEAFRWTSVAGMVGLGDFRDSPIESSASDISADGNVIVGRGLSANGIQACLWTEADGIVGLGDLEGGRFWSVANAVSSDGLVVVGYSESTGVDVNQAFRWTASDGMVGLGELPGGESSSFAEAVSDNGKVVVGWSYSEHGIEAFRWTSEQGMIGLGAFPDGEFRSQASGVSGDGEVVVGDSRTVDGLEAFIWTQPTGMRNLQDLLISQGIVELEDWASLRDPSISSNGQWIVGRGRNASGDFEAFRARIDSGASGFVINSGLTDAWFNPATNGQGFLLTVFPDIKQVFLAWFTYDTQRPPGDIAATLGEPGHRWLTAQGPYEGDTANLTVFMTEGGVFASAEPEATTDPSGDGVMTLEFADCTQGIVTYQIASLDISGEIPIQRIVNDNVGLCQQLVGD